MAVVLESIRVPHSSGFRTTLAPSPMASSVSAISSVQKTSSLPEFRGLRIQLRSQRRTLTFTTSRNDRIVRPRSRIVSEAQETTLEVPAVTDKSWESLVLKADLVLVEFWASWCGPCRMIHPVVSELSKQYAGKLKCYKLNTDDCPSIATQYGIRSIPTVMIFKNGEKKDAIIGAVPKTTLTNSIDKFV